MAASDEIPDPPSADSEAPRGSDPEDPLVICAFSGEAHPRSRMLEYGDQFVAPKHKEAFVSLLESGEPALNSRGLRDEPLTGDIGLIFQQSFRLLREHWLPVSLTMVLCWLPSELIFSAVDWHLVDYTYGMEPEKPLQPLQASMLPYLLNLTIGLVGEAILLLIAHRGWQGRSTDFFALLMPALGMWSRLFRTRILVTLATAVGFLLLVIPGFFIATLLALSEVTVVAEKRRPFSAAERSRALVRGHGWRVFFFAIVIGFGLAIPQVILTVAWGSLGIESWWTSALLTWLASLPLLITVFLLYVLYQHLLALHRPETPLSPP